MTDAQTSAPAYMTVADLRAALDGKDDSAVVVIDAGRTYNVPVLMAMPIYGKEIEGGRFRLGAGGNTPLFCLRVGQ